MRLLFLWLSLVHHDATFLLYVMPGFGLWSGAMGAYYFSCNYLALVVGVVYSCVRQCFLVYDFVCIFCIDGFALSLFGV